MFRQVAVGLGAGLLFLVLDGVIHANPLARQLYSVYEPISRARVNPVAGSLIDLAYGVVLAALFVKLSASLPGIAGWEKGLSFALVVWFLRVVMGVAGEWVTRTTPPATHAYTLATGLAQVAVVSVFIGVMLTPPSDAGPRPGDSVPSGTLEK